jgi:hypothetical protein
MDRCWREINSTIGVKKFSAARPSLEAGNTQKDGDLVGLLTCACICLSAFPSAAADSGICAQL